MHPFTSGDTDISLSDPMPSNCKNSILRCMYSCFKIKACTICLARKIIPTRTFSNSKSCLICDQIFYDYFLGDFFKEKENLPARGVRFIFISGGLFCTFVEKVNLTSDSSRLFLVNIKTKA